MWWQSVLGAVVVGFVVAQSPPPPAGASAEIRDATGRLLATATFRDGRGEVLVNLSFPQPPPLSGAHAIHINDAGRCDGPDFATSGDIFNPFNKQHGRNNPEGPEVGDLPNVNFSTGLTSYDTNAIGATLGDGPGSLVNPSRSIVIYSGTDDQQTPPDGNPGTPIGCGVIVAGPLSASPAPLASPATGPLPARAAAGASPSPSVIAVAAAPTPILILPTPVALAAPSTTQTPQSGTGPNLLNVGVIAVLGLALIGGGLVLRKSSAEADQ
jgi:Cu-Zn family superoxide dismutase